MRVAAKTKGNRKQVSRVTSLPSPIGGWNSRDSLAAMPATDAVVLKNWFPDTTECSVRKGYTQHSTGITGTVESLMVYNGAATSSMFAVASGACYDVTTGGAVAAAKWSGKSNSRWNYTNITTAGGSYLYCANGVDKPYLYNGSTWTAIDGTTTPAITGVTTTNLKSPIVFKNRVWFIEKNTLKTWYLPTLAVGGAAGSVDMSAVAQMGGYIVAHATWTIDAGTGIDDFYVAVTSKGEVIVYQGTDPTDSTKWALKGVWQIGSPVGERCLFKYSGDLLMICQDGLVPLSGALQSSRVNPKVALTDKIQSTVSQSVTSYGDNFGWQIIYYPKQNQLWMNIPVDDGTEQYAMNTITKSWAQYQGWEASCWCLFNDEPYFGGSTVVNKAWDSNSDNGVNINSVALPAFSAFGLPGQIKKFNMVRPIFRASGQPSINGSMNTDFDVSLSSIPLSYTSTGLSTWGSSTWGTSAWGGTISIYQSWQSVSGVGYYGSPQINTASKDIDLRWVSTEITFEQGSIL